MDHQYTYYTPGQDSNPQNNSEYEPPHKKKGTPKWVKTICFGLVFGVTASAAFQTSNIVAGKFLNNRAVKESTEKTENIGNAKLTTSSGSITKSDVADIAENAMPSVVSITNMSVQQVQSFFGGIQERQSESAGSGIIIGQNDSELLVVTNNHVVEGSDTLTVSFIDEESVEANIKGTDASRDLAVVAVDLSKIKDSTREKIAVATLGDSDQIQVGEEAIAIGNALGYGQSVTRGIISAKERRIEGFDSNLIQTDAAINPGNSGGALLNAKGEVIGINTAKAAYEAVEGIGYAIPVSEARETIEGLMNRETRTKVAEEERGYLGIAEPVDVTQETSQMYNMPTGVYITDVIRGGGAERAGITKGSVITALNGTTINNTSTLLEQLQYYKVGETVTVTIAIPGSNGEYRSKEVEVTLGKGSN
ncbi:MAG: PDZ domain-containing protein [Dorea sp.]|jgi:serine protease Do|nr:PDZ domain-containing protein [Dorea sp.]GFI43201.1 serine protease Do-like HtrA [Lachnospiraceae bacterium]